jgi:hypothetical protein
MIVKVIFNPEIPNGTSIPGFRDPGIKNPTLRPTGTIWLSVNTLVVLEITIDTKVVLLVYSCRVVSKQQNVIVKKPHGLDTCFVHTFFESFSSSSFSILGLRGSYMIASAIDRDTKYLYLWSRLAI